MAGYIGSKASVVSSGAEHKKTFTITGATTSLTGLNYTVGKVHVFQNGVRLVDGTDYAATNGTSITLTVAAQSGDNVVVVSQASFQLSEHYTSAEADAEFVNDPNGAITVDGDNVGIGTSSSYPLTVQSGTAGSNHALALRNSSNNFSRLGFLQTDSATAAYTSIDGDGRASGYLKFNTNDTERMRIDSSGNVGIGTSSPSEKLDVSGNIRALGANSRVLFGPDGFEAGIKYATDASLQIASRLNETITFTNGNDGAERMRIDSSGAVTMPAQPAFLVRPVGTQVNIPNLTTTTVLFGAEVFDQNSDFSSNTFTAPVTGKYQLSYGLRLEQVNSASSYYHFHLRTSNRLYANIIDPRCFDQNPDYWDIGLSALADMDAGDTAYITAFQAFGSAQMDIHGDSFFSGYLVA
jgi:hypothetical protein